MTADLSVSCRPGPDGHACVVEVGRDRGATRHAVTVPVAVLARMDPGAAGPERLVRESFAYLLEREPREAILRAFDLPLIERYFPGYEAEIASRLQRRPEAAG